LNPSKVSRPGRRPALFLALLVLAGCGKGGDSSGAPETRDIILATTTSTQDSGLLDELLPLFEEQTGYRVKTIAVGTGEALAMGSRGDADVLLAHAPEQERDVLVEGAAINRRLVMHNDFLIAGSEEDPAGLHGRDDGANSVALIAQTGSRFVSRGDNSGTHFREMSLWGAAGIEPEGDWYISTGQGMGATLMIAAEMGAYVLSDRGTFLAMRERTGLVPHVEGDPTFLNIYSVMEVNPHRFPRVNHAGATAFSEFILGSEAQGIIRSFGRERFGEPLFYPDAGKTDEDLLGRSETGTGS
jgi:tungstate transport system substrate-binding protein